MKQINEGSKQTRSELCDGCAGDTMMQYVLLNRHSFLVTDEIFEKKCFQAFFVCFRTPQICSKMLRDDSLCIPHARCVSLLWHTQHIMGMWTDESLDYKCSLCDGGEGPRLGEKKNSRLFGSAGPSQRPNQILYLAETKGIVRILSGFKKQSEWENDGGALTHM